MVVLTAIFLVIACQKEFSLDSGTATGSSAAGTLKDTLGNCQPITTNGNYITDSTLRDSNYVLIQVNITSAGNYKINTDIQNGYSFRDSGYFSATGLQTVKLKGIGKPKLPITSDFTVFFNNTNCFFRITSTTGIGGGTGGGTTPSVFTLAGSPNTCSNYTLQGTYKKGVVLSAATNKLILQVNVTTAGTYTITTTTVGGMKFGGTGTFTTNGLQTVTLTGTGTPTTAGTNTFPITAGSSTCSFAVNVTSSTASAADSAWSFTQGTKFYYGMVDTLFMQTALGVGTALVFGGSAYPTYDTTLDIAVLLPGTTIVPGTYPSTTKAQFAFDDINGKTIFKADPTTATANLQVVISAYDATTKIVTGTFAGTVLNAAGAPVPITGGKFKGVVK